MNKKKWMFIITIAIFLIGFINLVSAESLVMINNDTGFTLGGNHSYTHVHLINSKITIDTTYGYLNLTATDNITIDENSEIFGDEKSNYAGGGGGGGSTGGTNSNSCGPGSTGASGLGTCSVLSTGGIGGNSPSSFGATGSAGGSGTTGTSPGTESGRFQLITGCSAAGGGGGAGGDGTDSGTTGGTGSSGARGGGSIFLTAPYIYVHGILNSDGGDGGTGGAGNSGNGAQFDTGGPGGTGAGATGGIIEINANTFVNISEANILARGGGGGSDGAGGRVKVFYGNVENTSTNILVTGGVTGTIYYEQTNIPPVFYISNTIPASPSLGDTGVYFNLSINESDGDDITSVYFTLTRPNTTEYFISENISFVLGYSTVGEAEIWTSPTFDITNVTGHVGTWQWSFLTESNGSATVIESGSFIINDTDAPTGNVTSFWNDKTFYENKTIPINFVVQDNVEVDSCRFSLNNGTSNTTIPSCSNATFGSIAGTYFVTFWFEDTSNNLLRLFYENIIIQEDTTSPTITINQPTGAKSLTFNTDIDIVDLGTLDTCIYWVEFTSGGSAKANETVTCGSNIIEEVTLSIQGANYVFFMWVNDTSGNLNISNSSFSTSTSGTTTTGGGGGGAVIVEEGEWTMATETGGSRYDLIMLRDTSRTKSLAFENVGTDSKTISLECEGELCLYVNFENDDFELPRVADVKTLIDFTIDLPNNQEYRSYTFNIVAKDQDGNEGIITVNVDVRAFSFVKLVSTLEVTENFKINYFIIFMFLIVFSQLLFTRVILKDLRGKVGISFIISLLLSLMIVMVI